ncbi:kinase-like protein, partial [Caulochytrium protostelioides]
IWSLGVVLYVLICGALPSDGSTLAKLRERVLIGKYKVPFFMSTAAEALIRKMLVMDPEKRLTLQQIKRDPWYTEGCPPEPPVVETKPEPRISPEDHELIIKELSDHGLPREAVEASLNNQTYDAYAATYYLTADRRSRRRSDHPSPLEKIRPVSETSDAPAPVVFERPVTS